LWGKAGVENLLRADRTRMEWNIDLRYAIPAVISLIYVVLPSKDIPWIKLLDNLGLNASLGYYPIFVMICLSLAILIFVLLFTSVNLVLILERPLIYLRTRHLSLSWTLSLLASLLCPPSNFWLVFPILVIISHWDDKLLDLLF
jgi:hypothetical protein